MVHSTHGTQQRDANARQKTRTNSNVRAGFDVVEMRRLELLTPYMRSKCSTS